MKKWFAAAFALTVSLVAAFSSFGAQWQATDDGWVYLIDEANGTVARGWTRIKNDWYYLDPETGLLYTGWLEEDGKWYYLDPNTGGIMSTGWLKINDDWYYLVNGVLQTEAFEYGGYYYSPYSSGEKLGAIRINEEFEDEEGNIIHYDENGRANFYKADTDTWYLVSSSNVESSFDVEYDEETEEKIIEIKYLMYGKYRKTITKSDNEQNQARLRTWESEVKRRLQDYLVDVDIEEYIALVKKTAAKHRKYDPDDYDDDVDEEDVWREEIEF